MAFAIDKGIPLPSDGKTKYPCERLEVGDSFLVPFKEGESHEATDKRVRAACYGYSSKLKRKFLVRVVDGGIRCWRSE